MSTPLFSIVRILLVAAGGISLLSCKENKPQPPAPAAASAPAVKPQGEKPPATETAVPQKVEAPAQAEAPPPAGPQTPAGRDAARREAMEKFKKTTEQNIPPAGK